MEPISWLWVFGGRLDKISLSIFWLDRCAGDSVSREPKPVTWPLLSDILDLSCGTQKGDNPCLSGVAWSAWTWFRRSWTWRVKLTSLARKRKTSLSRVLKYWSFRCRCVLFRTSALACYCKELLNEFLPLSLAELFSPLSGAWAGIACDRKPKMSRKRWLAFLPDWESCLSGRRPGRKVNAFFIFAAMEGTGKSIQSLVPRQVRQIGAEEIGDLRLGIKMKASVSEDVVPPKFWIKGLSSERTYRKIAFSMRPTNGSGLLTESFSPIRD